MNIVCKQWTEDFEIKGYHLEDVLSLIKEAYSERAKEGISFSTLHYKIDDLLSERTDEDYWFLAFDEDDHLYGTARLTIKNDNWGEICNFAVSPLKQGKHVGSQLLQAANEFAKKKQLNYMMSYTAMKAISSVRCHCNNGFQIIGIGCNIRKNYSSYIFRNQLSQSFLWNSAMWIKFRFMVSYMKFKLLKRADGSNTLFGRLSLYIR